MGVQDGQERRLEAILRTLWEIVNSVGSGKLTFVKEFQKPMTPVTMLAGLAATLGYLNQPY